MAWGRGVLITMRGRGRITIGSCIPTMPGRSTSGFHRLGRHCLHHLRSAVRCWASRMNVELHPTKNREYFTLAPPLMVSARYQREL